MFGSTLGIDRHDHATAWVKLLKPLSVAPETAICARGQHTSSLYLIRSGEVQVSLSSGELTHKVVTLGPGSFFGELGLLSPGIGNADVVALGACELLELDAASFERMKKEFPNTARALMHDAGRVLALRVMGIEASTLEEEQDEPGLLERVANFLFNFGDKGEDA